MFQRYIKTVSSDQTETDQTIFQGNSKSVQQMISKAIENAIIKNPLKKTSMYFLYLMQYCFQNVSSYKISHMFNIQQNWKET